MGFVGWWCEVFPGEQGLAGRVDEVAWIGEVGWREGLGRAC